MNSPNTLTSYETWSESLQDQSSAQLQQVFGAALGAAEAGRMAMDGDPDIIAIGDLVPAVWENPPLGFRYRGIVREWDSMFRKWVFRTYFVDEEDIVTGNDLIQALIDKALADQKYRHGQAGQEQVEIVWVDITR